LKGSRDHNFSQKHCFYDRFTKYLTHVNAESIKKLKLSHLHFSMKKYSSLIGFKFSFDDRRPKLDKTVYMLYCNGI
jgi:hypothetical protein